MKTFLEPLTPDEEKIYIEKMRLGDKKAKDILIERNLRLVAHVVKKYYDENRENQDLISIGIVGLIKAVNTYNPDKGNRLVTYAAKCIENELLMMLRAEKKRSKDVSLNEPIGTDKEGNIIAGFYAGRTHSIISNTDCALGVSVNQEILEKILDYMKEYHVSAYNEETHTGLVRHVLLRYGFTSHEIMVCLVINGTKLPHAEALVESLRQIPGMTSITFSVNKEKTNVIMGNEIRLLWGQTYITDSIGNVKYQISPLSFYQVNPVQTEKLYGLALDYADLNGNETVWDLYCGIGTISLFLAQKAGKVYGVEIVPQAIDDARQNAKLNGIENAEFFVGKAEEVLPEKYEKEGIYADVIVVDPPRKGCDTAALETMVKMKPDRIVYVSCDSATLARDVKWLGERGYEVKKVKACDMFPGTVHVETVVLMSKVQK